MKDLNKLFEDTITALPTPGNAELGLTDDEQAKTLKVLNTVLADISSIPTLNPYYLIDMARKRIENAYGLTFDKVLLSGKVGSRTMMLRDRTHSTKGSQERGEYTMGGSYENQRGVIPNDLKDRFPYGLSVRISWVTTGTICHIDVALISENPGSVSLADSAK